MIDMKEVKFIGIVVVIFMIIFTARAVVASPQDMAPGATCYTNLQLEEKFKDFYQYGQSSAKVELFKEVAKLCESGVKVNIKGIGILSCEGVK